MKNNKKAASKAKGIYLIVALLLISAAVVVYLTAGLAPSQEHSGYRRYTAAVPYDFKEADIPALAADIEEAAGVPVTVSVGQDYLASYYGLEILTIPAADIDEQAVVDMLAEKYEKMNIESLSQVTYAPASYTGLLASVGVILLLALFVVLITSAFIVEGKNTLYILLATLLSLLMVAAVYVLGRVPHVRMLLAALSVAVTLTPLLGYTAVKELDAGIAGMKKPQRAEAALAAVKKRNYRSVLLLAAAAFIAAAFAAVGLVTGGVNMAWFAVMLFAGVACALYTSALIVPHLWIGAQKKR